MTYTALQLDAIKELGNIGSGNAATALSTMLNTRVDLNVTEIDIVSAAECYKRFGIPDSEICSVIHEISGALPGVFWLVMSKADRHYISQIVAGGLNVEEDMVLTEVSNILGGSYLRSLGDMMQLEVEISPPELTRLGQYIETHIEPVIKESEILLINNSLKIDERTIQCFISLVLEDKPMKQVLEKFGI